MVNNIKRNVGEDYRSPLRFFPDELLARIDRAIVSGESANACWKILKLNYAGTEKIPAGATMLKYVRSRQKFFADNVDAKQRVIESMQRLKALAHTRAESPEQIIRAMIELLGALIEDRYAANSTLKDARLDRVVVDATVAIQGMLKDQADLQERDMLSAAKLEQASSILMRHVMETIAEAYKSLHGGNKYDDFAKGVREAVGKLDFGSVEAEVANAVKALTAGSKMK